MGSTRTRSPAVCRFRKLVTLSFHQSEYFFCKIDDSISYFRTRQTAAEPYMWSELTNDTPLLKGYSFNCLQCFVEATCVQVASALSKASNAVPAVANASNLGTA